MTLISVKVTPVSLSRSLRVRMIHIEVDRNSFANIEVGGRSGGAGREAPNFDFVGTPVPPE